MKIGEFSEKFDVSMDTVRYYMEIGLLLPQKHGKNYEFGDADIDDMEFIVGLKRYHLSINVLNEIMSLKRQLNSQDARITELILRELKARRDEISEEIANLEQMAKSIDERLNEYSAKVSEPARLGLPLDFVALLRCPCCGKELDLKDTFIEKQQIISASAVCSCGYAMKIQDGVIYTGEDAPDKSNGLDDLKWWDSYIGGHIGKLDTRGTRIVNTMNKCYSRLFTWLKESPKYQSGRRNVILTCGDNSGRFLLYHLMDTDEGKQFLSTSTIIMYISSAEIPERVKSLISSFGFCPKLVFIVGDSYNLPLERSCIDIYIDDNSSFLYFAAHGTSLPDRMQASGYLNEACETYGVFNSDFLAMLKRARQHSSTALLDDIAACHVRPGLTTEKIYLHNKYDKYAQKSEAFVAYRILGKAE